MEFDSSIIAALKLQDRIVQKRVFEILYAKMYRICLRYVGTQAEAEDCVMTGFFKIFRKIDSFILIDGIGFESWCMKIMINESLIHIRNRNSFLTVIGDEDIPELGMLDILDKLENEELHNCILELPTGLRTVLNLFLVEGYSHKEIAEMLKISENTSKTQLLKAKQRLKSIIIQRRDYGLEARG